MKENILEELVEITERKEELKQKDDFETQELVQRIMQALHMGFSIDEINKVLPKGNVGKRGPLITYVNGNEHTCFIFKEED